jgi:hypothetical protein
MTDAAEGRQAPHMTDKKMRARAIVAGRIGVRHRDHAETLAMGRQ